MLPEGYINSAHYYTLLIHVIAGVTCLITGFTTIFANPKGGKLHRKSGIVYFWSMVVIFLTSFISVTLFKFNFFLFVLAVFSFFMCFTGYRSLKRKKPNQVKWYDKLVAWIGTLCGIGLAGYGIYILTLSTKNAGFASICLVFGFLLTTNAYKDIKHFRKNEYEKLWWWFHHLNMMMASFIAAFTAFLVNNIYKIVDLGSWNFIFWLLPTILIVPIMNKWTKYYKKKFNMN